MAEPANPISLLKERIQACNKDNPLHMQVFDMKKGEKRWMCKVKIGSEQLAACLGTAVVRNSSTDGWPLKDGTSVKLLEGSLNFTTGKNVLMILEWKTDEDVVGVQTSSFDTPMAKKQAVMEEDNSPPSAVSNGDTFNLTPPAVKTEPTITPLSSRSSMLNMTPFPVTSAKVKPATPSTLGKGPVSPIDALNPYDTNWKIMAKVTRKYPVRTFSRQGRDQRVLSMEVMDEEGTVIKVSLWREAVDRFEHMLEENKVYIFHKFNVRPANKQYGNGHDYELHMDQRLQLEEVDGESFGRVSAKLNLVPIEQIIKYINKGTFDVVGVILSVGQLGSVKRKANDEQVPRRDLVLGDESKCSVHITLWGDNAVHVGDSLSPGMVITVSNCRANDYNGCSVSALRGCEVNTDPKHERAEEIMNWYKSENPSEASFVPVGQGLANGRNGGGAAAEWRMLKSVKVPAEGPMPAADAAAVNSQVLLTVTYFPPEQQLYYLANKATGKKVTDGMNGFVDAAGTVAEEVEHRYVGICKAMDCTTEVLLNFFNAEGNELLGTSADDVQRARTSNEDQFAEVLKAAQWNDYVATISAKPHEYQGEVKMRYRVQKISKVDYAQQGRRLLEMIKAC